MELNKIILLFYPINCGTQFSAYDGGTLMLMLRSGFSLFGMFCCKHSNDRIILHTFKIYDTIC